VKRLAMLVTPDGRWVLEDSAEFLAELGDPDPDYDAALFAVKNLGFIRFQFFDNSLIEIELHPHNVKLPALLAVQQQVLSSRVKLFRIKHFEKSWKSEIMFSYELAVSRLSELCTPAYAPPFSDKFVAEPKDYNTLFATPENPLSLMAQKWRMSFGSFDPTVISFAIKHQLLSRMMILGVKSRKTDPVFRFIGDGFKWLETEYQFNGIGERMENLPDKEYGMWAAEFYKSVASAGQPRYDVVRAAIQARPTGQPLFITRYERLLLPWRTRSEEVFVTLSSQRLNEEDAIVSDAVADEDCFSNISAKSS
jgi:hypothetical protein